MFLLIFNGPAHPMEEDWENHQWFLVGQMRFRDHLHWSNTVPLEGGLRSSDWTSGNWALTGYRAEVVTESESEAGGGFCAI